MAWLKFHRVVFLLSLTLAAMLAGGCRSYVDQPLSANTTAQQLLNRSLSNPDLRDFLQTNLGGKFTEWPLKTWDFETLSWVALYYNPSLQIARAQWAVARGSIITSEERPNPSIDFTPGYDFNAVSELSPWFPGLSFDLPLETAGKRGKRMEQANWLAEAARQNVFTAAWQVRADLRRALIEWAAAGRRVLALHQEVDAETRVLNLLQQQLNAGAIAADELSATRVASIKAQSDAGMAERDQGDARARLAEILGVPVSALDGQEFSAADIITPRVMTPGEIATARAVSLESRADILTALANYQASQAALQLEIAKQYPDVHLGSGYLYDLGENKWNLNFGVELPLLNQNQGPIAEAEANRQLAAAQVVATQAHIIAQIDAASAACASANALKDDLDKTLGELQKHLGLIRAQIDAGEAEQLDFQTAQIDLSAADLALIDAQAQAAIAAGQLEDAFQVPFANLAAVQKELPSSTPPPTP
jgi:outer membrane protein TolC